MKITCDLCQSSSSCESTATVSVKRCEEQVIRHILYGCSGTKICFLCNDGTVYLPDNLKEHRIIDHRMVFERLVH